MFTEGKVSVNCMLSSTCLFVEGWTDCGTIHTAHFVCSSEPYPVFK